jgi:hypothetical protein
LSGGDGGRSSRRRRPGLGGDDGPWRWLFVVVGHFLECVVVVVAAVASKILKLYVSNKVREKTYLGPMRRRRHLIGPFYLFSLSVGRPGHVHCPGG